MGCLPRVPARFSQSWWSSRPTDFTYLQIVGWGWYIRRCQFDHARHQSRLIRGHLCSIPLRRPRMPQRCTYLLRTVGFMGGEESENEFTPADFGGFLPMNEECRLSDVVGL